MNYFVDYYKALGLSSNATSEEIKKNYHELAKKLHPDLYPEGSLTEEQLSKMRIVFTRCNEAYLVLKDEEKRKSYDIEYQKVMKQREEARRAEILKREAEQKAREEQERKMREEKERREEEEFFADARSRIEKEEREFEEAVKAAWARAKMSEEERLHPKKDAKKTSRYTKPFKEEMSEEEYFNFISYINQVYQEVRRDEKKKSFSKRHREVRKIFEKNYGDKVTSVPTAAIYLAGLGSVHVFFEAFYQLNKLSTIREESFPKFMIRNRKLIASAALATALFASGTLDRNTTQTVPDLDTISSIEVVETDVEPRVTLTRRYQVKPGDNLSILATNSFSRIEEIKSINNIRSNTIYIDDVLTIPYSILESDLDLYTQSVFVDSKSIDELASEYQTDVSTIYRLNQEAIARVDGEYVILSQKVIVPKFITRRQYNDIRGITYKTYER